MKIRDISRGMACVLAIFALSTPAYAYVGPGMGAGLIGVVVGLIGSIFLALFAVFWYPLKRFLARVRGTADAEAVAEQQEADKLNSEDAGEKL
jgi:hypothetical protein